MTIRKAPVLLAFGIALGVGIWVFSPWIAGTAEPWDADERVWSIAPIWPLSWLAVAILGGLIGDVRGACVPLGYALGQMLITIQSAMMGPFGIISKSWAGPSLALMPPARLSSRSDSSEQPAWSNIFGAGLASKSSAIDWATQSGKRSLEAASNAFACQ